MLVIICEISIKELSQVTQVITNQKVMCTTQEITYNNIGSSNLPNLKRSCCLKAFVNFGNRETARTALISTRTTSGWMWIIYLNITTQCERCIWYGILFLTKVYIQKFTDTSPESFIIEVLGIINIQPDI